MTWPTGPTSLGWCEGMSADRLTILAVDDERTQLEDLARLLRSFPSVEDVECASDGHAALVMASTERYDAIFLDVRMPDIDGLELGRVLRRFAAPPQLVFVSAYDNAAADAFELRALDYLRKPVSRRRVEEALERVTAAVDAAGADGNGHERQPQRHSPGDSEMIAVAAATGGATRLITRGSVLFVQSHGDFVRVVSEDGRYLLRATLSEIERRWEPHGFVRVHRQYVANLHRAVELRPQLRGTAELVFGDGQTIPIARRQVNELGRRLGV
jgi:DNA-binding LytR/AlgR family response regulator